MLSLGAINFCHGQHAKTVRREHLGDIGRTFLKGVNSPLSECY